MIAGLCMDDLRAWRHDARKRTAVYKGMGPLRGNERRCTKEWDRCEETNGSVQRNGTAARKRTAVYKGMGPLRGNERQCTKEWDRCEETNGSVQRNGTAARKR